MTYDWGYDIFIGKERLDSPLYIRNKMYKSMYVSLNLESGGSASVMSLESLYKEFSYDLKKGCKILLSQSPGKKDRELVKTGNVLVDLVQAIKDVGLEDKMEIIPNANGSLVKEDEYYELVGRKYVQLNKKELKKFLEMYETDKSLAKYPNPFKYQPARD